jgi:uncharacterized protein YjbJ (UPF0337 family)
MGKDLNERGIENQTEGKVEEIKGKIRGDVGDAMDDHDQHLKGRLEEAKGKAKQELGDAQRKIDEKT